jgi:hypothetical protein
MATGACSLENSPINLLAVREECERGLLAALDSIEGPKILVLDPQLIQPLGTVATISILKDHGVTSIFPLDADLFKKPKAQEAECCIFIARPRLESTRVFADHMRANGDKMFSLFFVPRRSITCERMLEEEGLLDQLAQPIAEIKLDLVPYDNDVLSLELGTSFRDLFLNQDPTELFYVAESMMRLQEQFGTIPTIRTKGSCAQKVKDIMVRLRRERGAGGGGGGGAAASAAAGEFDSLIILDRDVDLVTPMLTQITYEGLVDEHFGINCSAVQIDAAMAGDEKAKPGKTKKVCLNSDDTVYADIRDKNFSVVMQVLGQKTRDLKEAEDERHNAHSVGQIKDFVKKLGSLQSEKQSLQTFVNVAIAIKDECGDDFTQHFQTEQDLIRGDDMRACVEYLDQAIIDKKPLVSVLRQLCLLSLTSNELKQRKFDEIRASLLQSYGYPALFTLLNLEKAGLLQQYGARGAVCNPGNWGRARQQCYLFPDGGDQVERPEDIAYTYSGYAPLSCRLVQMAHDDGHFKAKPQPWGALDSDLPGGPSDEAIQVSAAAAGGGGGAEGGRKKKLTLVLFLGGVTYAEISALRFMGEKDPNRQYIVATTKILNGATMVESMVEQGQGLTMDRSTWGREARRYA